MKVLSRFTRRDSNTYWFDGATPGQPVEFDTNGNRIDLFKQLTLRASTAFRSIAHAIDTADSKTVAHDWVSSWGAPGDSIQWLFNDQSATEVGKLSFSFRNLVFSISPKLQFVGPDGTLTATLESNDDSFELLANDTSGGTQVGFSLLPSLSRVWFPHRTEFTQLVVIDKATGDKVELEMNNGVFSQVQI